MRFNRICTFLAILTLSLALGACDRVKSNVKLLQTTDCGKSWREVPTGQRVPTNMGSYCGYNITLPDYPMQGGTEFLTQFQNNVLVRVKIDYDYEIVDPLKYIQNAKFLGRMKSQTTDDDETNAGSNGSSQYEAAENVVIDIRLREQVTNSTKNEDIVKFNPSTFEDVLFVKANEVLGERGVKLNSMTFVTMPEDQTRMAIDAATAMAVYDSKGMTALGQLLVVARAGATRVTVEQKAEK